MLYKIYPLSSVAQMLANFIQRIALSFQVFQFFDSVQNIGRINHIVGGRFAGGFNDAHGRPIANG